MVKWTNTLLTPPPPHILQLMGAASQIPPLASRIANGFNNPPDYNPWWFDPNEAQKLIANKYKPAHNCPRAGFVRVSSVLDKSAHAVLNPLTHF